MDVAATGSGCQLRSPQFLEPLKQPAVDEHPVRPGVEQVFRAGDGAGGAEEGQRWHRRDYIEPISAIVVLCCASVNACVCYSLGLVFRRPLRAASRDHRVHGWTLNRRRDSDYRFVARSRIFILSQSVRPIVSSER